MDGQSEKLWFDPFFVFDSYLRRSTNGLFNGSAWLALTRYTYDAASRLQTVNDGTNYAAYSYVANSPLVRQISFTNNGVQRMTTSNYYDFLNRVTEILSAPSGAAPIFFMYGYNSANQRTNITNPDNSRWALGYDSLGQVNSGKKYWADGTYVAGEQFTYAFDDIGNRTTTSRGGDQTGSNLRSASYYANALNQYTNRTVPADVDILGSANSNANVMVQSAWGPPPWQSWYGLAYRKGEFFRAESPLDNGGAAAWLAVTTIAVVPGVTNADIQTNVTGGVFVPQTPEQYRYDADGNLYTDGHWTYAWDAENRLVKLSANLAGIPLQTIRFEYDWRARRIHKQVWNNATGTGSPTNDVKFVYDGWNPVAQLSTSNSVLQTYMWGLDMSGGMQGAGGVGGLLAVKDAAQGVHFAAGDGNGNVSALVNGADGTISATYEYGPFGEVIRASGTMAKVNPFRFSTKYQDDETDLLYYGYRYYNPSTGRWLSRDPIEESGGLNLQGFGHNDSINLVDAFGRWTRDSWSGGWAAYTGTATAESCDIPAGLSGLAQLITGQGSDSSALGSSDRIKVGQKVNIAPLLKILEDRLRANVVSASGSLKANFGGHGANIPGQSTASGTVNQFFGSSKVGVIDCLDAISLVFGEGLINTLAVNEFDGLGWTFNSLPVVWKNAGSVNHRSDMLAGDAGYVQNYTDIPRGWGIQGQNFLKVANDSYWGFGFNNASGTLTLGYAGWLSQLRQEYTTTFPNRPPPTAAPPGFNGDIRFLDTAKIGMRVFDLRKKKN